MNPDETALDAVMTYRVATEQRDTLAALIGAADRPAVLAEWRALDAAWPTATSEGERRVLAAGYLDAVAPYRAAYDALRLQIALLDSYVAAAWQLATFAAQLGDEAGAAALWADALGSERSRTLLARLVIEQGTGQYAYSIKLSNVGLKLVGLSAAAASLLASVEAYLDPDKSGLAIATAVLTAVAGLSVFMERIPIDDASVFLGLVEAGGEARQAHLAEIIDATNAARAKAPGYLQPLNEEQVKQAINNLLALHSIVEVKGRPDVWQVIEDHGRIRGYE